MSWSKRQLINQAYGCFGLSNYAYSLTPQQVQQALFMLDTMMAAWATTGGIRIGYNGSSDQGTTDENQASGIPDFANMAVSFKLSEIMAGTIGKQILSHMLITGANAFEALQSWCASNNIPEMQYARDTPRGSGNKPYRGAPAGVFFQPGARLDTGAGDSFLDSSDGSAFTVDSSNTFTYP